MKMRVTATVTADTYSALQTRAGGLTRAEGQARKLPDVAALALAFYLRDTASCLSCQASTACEKHGTNSLRPSEQSEKSTQIPTEAKRLVSDMYVMLYTEARGVRPTFTAAEANAVRSLLIATDVDPERACTILRNAFADEFWRARATILTIAADPSKHLGTSRPTAKPTSLQPDSGYQSTGRERR